MGTIEEITSTYVVVRLRDWRRMIVPLSYFIEKSLENWTRESSSLIGTVMLYVDYRAPVGIIRDKLREIVQASKNWDGGLVNLQVTDARETTIELRCLMSARSAGQAFDLRCEVREQLIDFLQKQHLEALPRQRSELVTAELPAAKGKTDKPVRDAAGGASAGNCAVHVAFCRPRRLWCLGIHQRGFCSPPLGGLALMVAMTVPEKKADSLVESAFFAGFSRKKRAQHGKVVVCAGKFTGVGISATLRQGRSLAANALTSF